ncbi:uncharacterized protein An09g04630 [Aspergillus niger]|uniref:Contig An09c0130, genomic contig n=2 Tax=Aspergillus niger TaxID=5061 RepID=A2QU74_ASPNC|nr:uncharacterized protein An09g04630 [Aspergillus niger]CAK40317.1 unnamed protein product [Aspergillus niger]
MGKQTRGLGPGGVRPKTGQKIESLSIRICNHVLLVLLLDKYTNAEQKLTQ